MPKLCCVFGVSCVGARCVLDVQDPRPPLDWFGVNFYSRWGGQGGVNPVEEAQVHAGCQKQLCQTRMCACVFGGGGGVSGRGWRMSVCFSVCPQAHGGGEDFRVHAVSSLIAVWPVPMHLPLTTC